MGIKLKRSAVAGKVPVVTDLELGELAMNTTDGKLFLKKKVDTTESIVEVGVTEGSVDTAEIVDGAVTSSKIADGSITGGKIATGAVSSSKIADGSVSLAKLGGDITAAGKALLDDANAAAQRGTLGLGGAALLNEMTAADFRSNTAGKVATTDKVWAAAVPVALAWAPGGSISLDLNTGLNFTMTTATSGSTLAAPLNAKPGQGGCIEIIQSATAPFSMGFASAWKFAGGIVPALSTTPGARDLLYFNVISASVVHASLIKDVR